MPKQLELFPEPDVVFPPLWRWELLPPTSKVWDINQKSDVVLIRPYSPEARTPGGIIVEKNRKWAKVWCHILSIPQDTFDRYPELEPGQLCVYRRHSSELVGHDRSINPDYVGLDLEIHAVHVTSLEAVLDGPDVVCAI
jgi:hypothetical protein